MVQSLDFQKRKKIKNRKLKKSKKKNKKTIKFKLPIQSKV